MTKFWTKNFCYVNSTQHSFEIKKHFVQFCTQYFCWPKSFQTEIFYPNFCDPKTLFDSKYFWIQNLTHIFFWNQNVLPQNLLLTQIFSAKKWFSFTQHFEPLFFTNIFLPVFLLSLKYSWTKNIYWPVNLLSLKYFWTKSICWPNFLNQNFFHSKIFWSLIFLSKFCFRPKVFRQNFFFGSWMFWINFIELLLFYL